MNFNRLDLNLLLVFDAIFREGNITRAGQRLGLSQPAVSAALARLRDVMGDPLFIRNSSGVTPTARATEIAEPLDAALCSIRDLLQEQLQFDPLSSRRCFRILMPDVGGLHLLPRLLEHIRDIGSDISIATTQIANDEQLAQLEKGTKDLAVGVWSYLTPARGFYRQPLFTDSFVCVTRSDHQGLDSPATLDQLLQASHIVVSNDECSQGPLERMLAPLSLSLKVAVRIPHYLAVPMILERSDLVVIMPARPASIFAQAYGFRIVPLAFKLPSFEVCQYWHHRFNRDPGLNWLIGVMHKLFADSAPIGPNTVVATSRHLQVAGR